MAGEHPSKLYQQLLEQNLTPGQIDQRLSAIIDREAMLPDGERDEALLEACLDLQWYLATGEHYASHREAARARLAGQIRREDGRRRRIRRMLPRVAAVACCAALLLFLPSAVRERLNAQKIRGTTIEGGEVYQLNGETVEASILDAAIARADADAEDLSITTTDYQMIAKIQGVEQMHLGYVPEGWKLREYRFDRKQGVEYYLEHYENGEKKILDYECTQYPDAESVVNGIEQNNAGIPIAVGKREVYFTQNLDTSVAMWSDRLTSYAIHGPLTQEEVTQMVESVGGR